MDSVQKHFADLDEHLSRIESMSRLEEFLLSKHPALKKAYVLLFVIFVLFALVLLDIAAPLITNFVALVFPAYESIRAIQTEDGRDDIQWLSYWVVFALTVVIENFLTELIAENLSVYFAVKYVFCIWLMYPGTRGAQFIFDSVIMRIPALRIAPERKGGSSVRSALHHFLSSVSGQGLAVRGDDHYSSQVESAVPSIVRMFSGCMDEQTSADVHDTGSFGIPPALGPSGAGGACTNSFLLTMEHQSNISWSQLLLQMRDVLEEKKYTQVPQLSASRSFNLDEKFSLINPLESQYNGKRKALLIGINYVGTPAVLRGCINDVKKIRKYLERNGFSDFRELTDDTKKKPTVQNIVEAIMWLVRDAKPGDSLFLHYSGHGGRIPDDGHDEHDGFDETLIPLDYETKGQIRDDDLYKLLIAPLPSECYMTVIMDCCHSGTILDLPYAIKIDADAKVQLESSEPLHLGLNPRFSLQRAYRAVQRLFDRFKGDSRAVQAANIDAFKDALAGSVLISESGEKQSVAID